MLGHLRAEGKEIPDIPGFTSAALRCPNQIQVVTGLGIVLHTGQIDRFLLHRLHAILRWRRDQDDAESTSTARPRSLVCFEYCRRQVTASKVSPIQKHNGTAGTARLRTDDMSRWGKK